MITPASFDKCLPFINSQLQPASGPRFVPPQPGRLRVVTISRQSGSGGHVVAAKLAEALEQEAPEPGRSWTVIDRNLVEKVLEDHHLPKHLARFLQEDRISEMADTMDELFGLHPPSWTLVRQTAETIHHLAEQGNVILIGRAGNIITAKMPGTFHVRLVGSLEKRAAYIAELNHLSLKAAREFVRREDLGRRRYLKKYFDKNVDDPMLYHLVINTDLVPYAEAAQLIAQSALRRTPTPPPSA
jgi:cytidylate kinase